LYAEVFRGLMLDTVSVAVDR